MIKAIIFDFDYTLSNRTISFAKAIKDIVNKYLGTLEEIEKDAIVQKLLYLDEFGTRSRKYSVEYLASTYNLEYDTIKEEFDALSMKMAPSTVLDDDTIEILEYLKNETDYKLAILTNGIYESQKLKIDSTNIAKYFDEIVMSAETGYQKPDPRAFIYTANKLNLKTDECLYIGDVFFNDILGAYKANMHYVLINNFKKWSYPNYLSVIERLLDLKEYLAKIQSIDE